VPGAGQSPAMLKQAVRGQQNDGRPRSLQLGSLRDAPQTSEFSGQCGRLVATRTALRVVQGNTAASELMALELRPEQKLLALTGGRRRLASRWLRDA
jgi:hypothetical protein